MKNPYESAKVLISDEITEKVISQEVFLNRWRDEGCDYPVVKLEDGERFYFNRFVFL